MTRKKEQPVGAEEQLHEEETLRQEGEKVLEAFLRYQRKAAEETRLAFESLIPEGFRTHSREAKRAFKKSFKVLLQELAERLEPEEEEGGASTTGKTKVKVEVN